ncbi:hypothetical protein EYC98_14710 [Halieaceae bacterium IMCC14734]|uniref:Capsule biosynthesis protein n=1 Tax=Candidatus Litorirhabdus singularis TaxID=2518993 RepID=A0ABT3TIS2_9GAMM|nr:hypothetical protein [Candidatus Litorirhabdus singularis]MCX2982110.1 hypothetical protein [Candidatus Litorirhabdus singularis]
MKILLFTHKEQILDYSAYMNGLKKAGPVQARLLTIGREESEFGLETGSFDSVKDILPGQSELDGPDADLTVATQELKNLEERIGSLFIHRDILMDRRFRGQPSLEFDLNRGPLIWTGSRTILFMYALYRRLEEELAEFKPDVVFVETNSAPYRMIWRLAREKGIPAGHFFQGRVWPERVYMETGLGLDWHLARTAYMDMADNPMTGEELIRVEQKLDTITQQKTKPASTKWAVYKGAPGILTRLNPVRLLAGNKDWLGQRSNTATINPRVMSGQVYSPLAKYLRYRNGQKAQRFLKKHQTPFELIRKGKYAMYFLHHQPELSVEEMAFEYQEQVNTLRNILASLPSDMSLVVKEHSPMLGRRQIDTYSRLLHMPGMIFAESSEDSHKLVAHASVVITLTGTVGLEAIFYGIPAIVLGSVFFDCFDGIYKPESLQELTALLSNPSKLAGASREDALRAVGSMLRGSVPGMMSRDDTRLQEPDLESAKNMFSALERARPPLKQAE